jgi:cobalt transporter subunit CbtB
VRAVTDWAESYPREAEVQPPAIALSELWPWALLALALVALVGLVSFSHDNVLHEFFHDGRHLLAFPCH